MFKRNLIHSLSVLLLISFTSCISAEHYYIVPNDSSSQCQSYLTGNCFTLAEFASNSSHHNLSNNLTFSFFPGEHLLTRRLMIDGPQNIALAGHNTSNSSMYTIKCQGTSGFEFEDIQSLNITYLEFNGCGNVLYGGAIYINSADRVLVKGCHFISNHVTWEGGAIYVRNIMSMKIEETFLNNNYASAFSNQSFGGAFSVNNGSIFTINSHYIDNTAAVYGGAIYVSSGSVSTTTDHYVNNYSQGYGGAIYVESGYISSTNDHYTNNGAIWGGAIYVSSGSVSSINDQYKLNDGANWGGAIYVACGNIFSTSDHYINNRAEHGGAIYLDSGNISSIGDHYINNSADHTGGAIFMGSGSGNMFNDSFKQNTAVIDGAIIHKTGGTLEIGQSNVTDNYAYNKGALYLDNVTLVINEGVNFINNRGSLYISSTKVQFNGATALINNSGDFGGAITAIQQSQLIFNTTSSVSICNNKATYGGGIYLAQSSLHAYHPFKLADNKATYGGGIYLAQSSLHAYHPFKLADNRATEYGGGIYASRSEIDFTSEHTETLEIINNTALSGGALCAIASNIHISKTHVDFNSNRAVTDGGAMYLGQNSRISLLKNEPDYMVDDNLNVRLDFTNNSAKKGGAIFVAVNTNDGVLCRGANTENQTECFIQTLKYYPSFFLPIIFINTIFTNNTAHQSGSDIHGGLLDQCTINPHAELVQYWPHFKASNGFDYIKATAQIEQIIDYSQYAKSDPDYLTKNISKSNVLGLISSDGILEFCSDNIVSPSHNVSPKKGAMFTVSVAVVDQVGNLINATVSSSLSSESGNGHFKGGQAEQRVGNQCTELEYNVYPQDNLANMYLYLYADGTCGNIEVSKLTLYLAFLPCECPVGFQPSSSETECICECDQRLKQHQITRCFSKIGTIQVETNIWIGVTNSTNGTGFVIHDCPFDYCVQKPVNISLSSPDSADEQCAYNRTGSLCGMCKDLSFIFGSSRCEECSHYYLFLLIPFALAGIALVAFILLLNITVATGTVHGLIIFANIFTANRSLFLPFVTPNFLTVFISWLNLDLGIETCFYNGMDSYSKFLLQLAFPVYVFVLIGTIIVLCEVSKKFSTLLGNRNPVAALCTLILLSYSKLIHTIITALQFTHLDYPDGSSEIVWLYDANISYFAISHIPRFITAFIIFILGTAYTILLLFGQWFPRCSNRRLMKWTKNTKYNAFIDAYHAPFTPKHRYWMGLLLFALTIHNIVAAMTTDGPVAILSAGCIAHGLIMLKLLNTRIYKNRLQDSLETLFLTNLVILAIATLYNIIRETNQNQLALANTSMAISLILFLVILGYHVYKYILKDTQAWTKVIQCFQRKERAHNRRQMYHFPPQEDEEPLVNQDTLDSNNQLREPALDIIDPVYTDDYRDPSPPPVIHKPPKITYTVIDGRPGHKDSDPVPCGPAGQKE